MKNIEYDYMSDVMYNEILKSVTKLTAERIKYLNPVEDIANNILIRLLKKPLSLDLDEMLHKYVESAFPQVVEDVFDNYQKISFRYCLKQTHEQELSEDISQDTIMQLLLSRQPIKNVNSWLFQVTHNLLCKYFERNTLERKLLEKLQNEANVLQQLNTIEDSFNIEGLSDAQKAVIFADESYKRYEEMISFESVRDYAASMNVSLKVAQKRKGQIIRNLKSKALIAMGWRADQAILSYNQYVAIQRFIREFFNQENIAKYVKNNEEMHEEILSATQRIAEVHDWGIDLFGENQFRLNIFHLNNEVGPVNFTIIITLNERNNVSIDGFKENQLMRVFTEPANFRLPMHLGKAIWDYEKIISILTQ